MRPMQERALRTVFNPQRKLAMGNIRQVTPFMHVDDIDRAIAFFIDILGFSAPFRMGDYAYVEREGAAVRILENQGEEGAPPGNRRFAYYFDVHDVDALHSELKPRLDTLLEGDVCGPIDQDYGQRELLVLAPDGNLVVFGQAITGGGA